VKRFAVSLVIMVVIGALAIFGISYADNCCKEIIKKLDNAKVCAYNEDYEGAKRFCVEARDSFEGKEKVLTVFLNHNFVEQIEVNLNGLVEYANKETSTAFLAALEESKTKLLQLKKAQLHIP